MYAPEIINEIHNRLQRALPHSLVFLGGSYLYGEATADSDLDFYAICRFRDLITFARYRKTIKEIKSRYPAVRCNITVVPRFLFKHGWYYVYGKDVDGEIHRSAIYPALIIRNSLKLAYYHYLRALISDDLHTRQVRLTKSAQQMAAALVIDKRGYSEEPFFSARNLVKQLKQVDHNKFGILTTLLQSKLDNDQYSHQAMILTERVLGKAQELAYCELKRHAGVFLFPNYLIYNMRFLLRGKLLFLFRNPDKMIIEYLRVAIYHHEKLKEIEEGVKKVVFPVMIL